MIDSIRISWPSGVTFDTTGVGVRQSVAWLERPRVLGVEPAGGERRELELSLGSANPFVNRLSLGFSLPAATDVRLTVHDLQGRLVQTLATGVRTAGQHRVSWNARAADGSAASPGVYWVRLAARDANGEQVRTRKVVLSR
ncbi:MAG: T9SS type A sorting domain-containing protein [Candidatus Eisenbacteria bacterium]|nr:T9SS type A sorting domain-containing protein [Candidatus Eisenbacteria bacterium]